MKTFQKLRKFLFLWLFNPSCTCHFVYVLWNERSVTREMGDRSISAALWQYRLHHHAGYDVLSLELNSRVSKIHFRLYTTSSSLLVKNILFNISGEFYIHESVHRESNSITVQQDATYSVYYISVGSSTCFGC